LARGSNRSAAGFVTGGFFLAIALLMTACTHSTSRQIDRLRTANVPATIEITQTPFFPQERYQCGPAALATSLKYSGVDTTAEQLVPQVYLPAREGSLQTEMLAAARRNGRLAYLLNPSLDDLVHELADDNPVLVLQNLGMSWYPKWHYAVVVGYDLDAQELVLRSGTTERKVTPLALFDRTWRRGNRWAMIVVAPEKVPVTATEKSYLKAVLPFEQLRNWKTANVAYRAAMARWPGSLGATMGTGNTYYQLRSLANAERAYRAALTIDSEHAPAHNNLAQVLMERNRLQEGQKHAAQAVAIGGLHQDAYRKTLDEIEKKLGLQQP
jgi:tetratricopeptide (TPR) repeat protein